MVKMENDTCNISATSTNSSSSISPGIWPTWQILLVTLPLSLLILEIILGNLLVIIAILAQPVLRTSSNMIILSLAIADLAVGVFILPLNLADMILGWQFGKVLCRIWLTADVTLCSTSILHISAIAVDRFRSINEGVGYAQGRTIRMPLICCGVLWVIALWIASSPVLGWNDWEEVDGEPFQQCQLTRELGYIIHSASGAFFIPTVIMVAIYIKIFFLIRQKLRERARMSCIDRHPSSASHIQLSVRSSSFYDKRRKKNSEQIETILKNKYRFSLSKERKAAKTLGLIIGAFILCWTPFTLMYLASGILTQLCKSKSLDGNFNFPPGLFQTLTWLGYLNSGVNPIIYTIYNPDFRRTFKHIWTEVLSLFRLQN